MHAPRRGDGLAMWELARDSESLETNTAYCYVLLADEFRDTCAVAERDGRVAGMVAGFIPPRAPDTLFVWQVGVRDGERGRGLAKQLILELLRRRASAGLRYLEATVAASNAASMALFRSVAKSLGAPVAVVEGYAADEFPDGHEAEPRVRIGPLSRLHQ